LKGLVSPLLANIYLHELDDKMADIRVREERGSAKATNPQYKRLTDRIYRLRKKGATDTPELRALIQQRRALPSVVVDDPNFIRIKYQRYADDWLVGICGPRSLAEHIKEELTTFLSERLHLTLSEEKTRITHARTEEAHFLGTLISVRSLKGGAKIALTRNGSGHLIKRRSTGHELLLRVPITQLLEKLHQRGFCTALGKPTAKGGWTALDADQIVRLYNGINRGIQNYYRFADNFSRLNQLQYILYISLVKTLAMKYRCTARNIYRKFGKELTIRLPGRKDGKEYHLSFFLNHDWKKQRDGFQIGSTSIDLVQWTRRLYTRSKLGHACCVCNATTHVEMHHVRHIRKVGGKKPTGFNVILQALNRKQIPVCQSCHKKIHRGEYDQMRLSDLAYNPYASEKRK
jgi:Type II intron maturase